MDPADRRRAEVAFVRSLPNFSEIRSAVASDLHYPGGVSGRFSQEYIVLTPMNLAPPISYMMLSRFDYVQEHVKFLNGDASWDDSSHNKAEIGDLFAFVFYQPAKGVDKMEVFEIVNIVGPEHRRPNWIIKEHSDRRVLRLSIYLGKLSYSAFAAAKGYKLINQRKYPTVRGTVRTKWPQQLDVQLQGRVEGTIKEEEKEEVKQEDVIDVVSEGEESAAGATF